VEDFSSLYNFTSQSVSFLVRQLADPYKEFK
jgi:hypothetical protein